MTGKILFVITRTESECLKINLERKMNSFLRHTIGTDLILKWNNKLTETLGIKFI